MLPAGWRTALLARHLLLLRRQAAMSGRVCQISAGLSSSMQRRGSQKKQAEHRRGCNTVAVDLSAFSGRQASIKSMAHLAGCARWLPGVKVEWLHVCTLHTCCVRKEPSILPRARVTYLRLCFPRNQKVASRLVAAVIVSQPNHQAWSIALKV